MGNEIDIKDPNVILVKTSNSFDHTKAIKKWIDSRATDPQNHDRQFLYRILVRDSEENKVVEEMVVLNRADAATANIMPPGTYGPTVAEIPVPVRELAADEVAFIDPFGKVTVTRKGAEPGSTDHDLLVSVLGKLDEILAKLA